MRLVSLPIVSSSVANIICLTACEQNAEWPLPAECQSLQTGIQSTISRRWLEVQRAYICMICCLQSCAADMLSSIYAMH